MMFVKHYTLACGFEAGLDDRTGRLLQPLPSKVVNNMKLRFLNRSPLRLRVKTKPCVYDELRRNVPQHFPICRLSICLLKVDDKLDVNDIIPFV